MAKEKRKGTKAHALTRVLGEIFIRNDKACKMIIKGAECAKKSIDKAHKIDEQRAFPARALAVCSNT